MLVATDLMAGESTRRPDTRVVAACRMMQRQATIAAAACCGRVRILNGDRRASRPARELSRRRHTRSYRSRGSAQEPAQCRSLALLLLGVHVCGWLMLLSFVRAPCPFRAVCLVRRSPLLSPPLLSASSGGGRRRRPNATSPRAARGRSSYSRRPPPTTDQHAILNGETITCMAVTECGK